MARMVGPKRPRSNLTGSPMSSKPLTTLPPLGPSAPSSPSVPPEGASRGDRPKGGGVRYVYLIMDGGYVESVWSTLQAARLAAMAHGERLPSHWKWRPHPSVPDVWHYTIGSVEFVAEIVERELDDPGAA